MMGSSSKAPAGPKPKPAPVGGFLDQLASLGGTIQKQAVEELAKGTFTEAFRQFGVGPGKIQEQVLFDGSEARKKAEKGNQEVKNQLRIQSLQQELAKIAQSEQALRGELTEISQNVVQVAKSAGLETPHGIEKIPARPGIYHKVFYTRILAEIRQKTDKAKDWRSTQQTRVSSKPARGALLWTGDQKKVHEAGGMFLLQG